MSMSWFALIDEPSWHDRLRGNPFASMQALWSDLVWLLAQEQARRSRLPRTLQVRRALEWRVRSACEIVHPFRQGESLLSMVRYELPEPVVMAPTTSGHAPSDLAAVGAAPPGGMTDRMAAVLTEQHRGLASVWRAAAAQRCGLVIGGDAYQGDNGGTTAPPIRGPSFAPSSGRPLSLAPSATADGSQDRHWVTLAATAAAGDPWSPGHIADATLCELLWRLSASALASGELLVRFRDGTVGTTAVSPRRARPGARSNGARVRLVSGLMSLRHSDIDRKASFYWFRNEPLSSADRMADAAEAAQVEARQTLERLAKMAEGRPLTIDMYLTGFHPALVGLLSAIQAMPAGVVDLELVPLVHQGMISPRELGVWQVTAS